MTTGKQPLAAQDRERPYLHLASSSPQTGSARFPAELAHDLRGMITVISGHAKMLSERTGRWKHGQQQKSCRAILWSCKMISDLIDNLQAYDRIESRGIDAELQHVDLTAHLKRCAGAHAIAAEKKTIRIALNLCPEHMQVAGHPLGLTRIISNLVSNAIKFSPRGSTVTLSTEAAKDHVILAVQDQGPGIPPDEIPRLFEPFVKGSAQPTGGERCTGLGLYIVNQMVRAHQGRVDVTGRPGEGSVFQVTLPRSRLH